jgi:hypothetical protein
MSYAGGVDDGSVGPLDLRTLQLARVRALLDDSPGWKAVLWGELSGMPLPDLLNILSHGRRSGLLIVRGLTGEERALGFVDGSVTFAASMVESEKDDPREVAYALLKAGSGNFTFLRGPEGALPRHWSISAHEMLLHTLGRLDQEAGSPETGGLLAG